MGIANHDAEHDDDRKALGLGGILLGDVPGLPRSG